MILIPHLWQAVVEKRMVKRPCTLVPCYEGPYLDQAAFP
jgi:hypothetical protein